MPKANLRDRASIARLYPADRFARDAAANDRGKQALRHGVRIVSAPDAAGDFELDYAAQYAGEVPGAAFVAPFHHRTAREHAAADPDPRQGYEAFLDEIAEAARHLAATAPAGSPGPGDPRLHGLRQ